MYHSPASDAVLTDLELRFDHEHQVAAGFGGVR